ncbi:MAG TPA: TlpA disulfide reductase family protein [Balneolaceae bacterium]
MVVLDFWSVSCGPCIEEIPRLNDLAKKYSDKTTLISINSDLLYGSTKEELQEFVAEHNIRYPVILDTQQKNLMQQFGVNGWPARFLLNKEGYFFEEPVENRIKLSLREIENYLKQL